MHNGIYIGSRSVSFPTFLDAQALNYTATWLIHMFRLMFGSVKFHEPISTVFNFPICVHTYHIHLHKNQN